MVSRATSTEHPNPPSIASFWDSSEIRAKPQRGWSCIFVFSSLSFLLLFSRSQFSSVHVISVTVTFHVSLLSLSWFLFFPLCYPLPLTFLPCLLRAHFSLSPMSLRRTWTILGWYESRSAYTVLVSVYHYHVPIHWCSFPHFNLGWKPRGKHLTSGPKFMLDVIHPQP